MPKITAHQSNVTTKLLLIGEPGAGKTGALISLAEAGYNLRILDVDNGVDILFNLTRDKPEIADRIVYETVTEKMKTMNGRAIVDGLPKQMENALKFLDHWKVADKKGPDGTITEPGYDLGKVTSWGPKDVLVIDSLSRLSDAALRFILALNNRSGQKPHQSDWGEAMGVIENLLTLLYSDAVKCNVIIMAHITYLGGDEEGNGAIGYPYTLGKKLPPKVGSFFNAILLVKQRGIGAAAKRVIVTAPDGTISVKNPSPLNMPKELPQATGLAEFFKIVRGPTTPALATAPAAAAPAK